MPFVGGLGGAGWGGDGAELAGDSARRGGGAVDRRPQVAAARRRWGPCPRAACQPADGAVIRTRPGQEVFCCFIVLRLLLGSRASGGTFLAVAVQVRGVGRIRHSSG